MRTDSTAPTRRRRRTGLCAGVLAAGVLLVLPGCATSVDRADAEQSAAPTTPAQSAGEASGQPAGPPAGPSAGQSSGTSPSTGPSGPPTESSPAPAPATRGPRPSDGRPAPARLSIPALGLSGLPVVPYRGWTDDAPGTRIQDAGRAASPHGPRGGVGPGGVGNYQVTAHRLSSTAAFRELPSLRRGDEVVVVARGRRWTYRVVATRETSFRSAQSLREQRAAVPGRPGVEPTRAMITLSTCATIEDHAAGNYWSDEFGNPEHRIDKVGRLVHVRPVA